MFKFYLVNTPKFPTPGTHFFCISKFLNGFKFNGYYTEVIKSFDHIDDSEYNVFIMSDHHNNPASLIDLSKKYKESIFILWFHHKWYSKIPFNKFIITGEHFYEKPSLPDHLKCWELQQKINNYVPLIFSSGINPDEMSIKDRLPDKYDCCYIGNSYNTIPLMRIPNSFIYDYNMYRENFLDEEKRLEVYKSSIVAPGFHHYNNLSNHVVVERVFEAMSYGCIVVTDNPTAEKITNGLVKVVNSIQEINDIIKYYKENPSERVKVQEAGYKWIKENGTYKHNCKLFIQKIKELFFNKNVLITGGCGFVGRHLVNYLSFQNKYNITVVDNLSSKGSYLGNNKDVNYIVRDCRDFFKENKTRFDIVFHLAATVEGRESIENEMFKVGENLDLDMKFFDWCRITNPHKIVYFSSSAAYPINLQTENNKIKLSEDMIDFENFNIGVPDMTYGWAKLTGEFLAHLSRQKYNLDIKCFRPFSGYGKDQDLTYPFPSILKRVINKESPLTLWSNSVRDFVHIDDVISYVMKMLYTPHKHTYNIGTGVETSFKELAEKMWQVVYNEPLPEIKILDDKPKGVYYRVSEKSSCSDFRSIEQGIQESI